MLVCSAVTELTINSSVDESFLVKCEAGPPPTKPWPQLVYKTGQQS